jgi:mono/diheme cytochrome c family protein
MIHRLTVACVLVVGVTLSAGVPQSTIRKSRSLLPPSMEGRDIFQFYCASCHGRDGTGNGPVASALKTKPADLTRLAMRNDGTFPRMEVEAFVTNGKPDMPAHGSRDMPVWGPTFRSLEPSDRDVKMRIANVVEYLESIQMK